VRFAARLIGLALSVVLLAAPARAELSFPPLTGRVVDAAQMLSPAVEQRLDGDLAQLEASTGRQLVVATVPDLQGQEIEDYGYQLGRKWALGRKGVDDGAILLVAPNQRKVRIEVGYGLEPVLTDALSNVILQQKVLPRFREGNMEQGVVDGTEALIQQLGLPDDQARAQVAKAAQSRSAQGESGGLHVPLVFVVFLVIWVLSSLVRGRGRRGGALWLLPFLLSGGGGRDRWGGGGGWGGGGFSGGGGSFGGGGSSGRW